MFIILAGGPANAAGVKGLAACTVSVFREIGRTQTWSGKTPATCHAAVAVTKVADGIAVSAWTTEPADAGWARTTFTAVLDYSEMASNNSLSAALRDVVERGNHLERCLRSLKKSNDPLDCQVKGTRDYLAGEETGVKDSRTIWPDNNGRHTVVEYKVGSTIDTPDTPIEVEAAQPLPPGLLLNLRLRGNTTSPSIGTGQ
jgi:hypothetical protein